MRLIDADALLKHQVEADKMSAMLVVGKGFIMDAPTITPQPDPDTGLVPCGCGGQAVFEGSFLDEEVPSSYRVSLSCIECGISTIAYEYEQEAMKDWNRAMGYTAPPLPDEETN